LDISKKQNGFTVVSTDESFFFFDSLVRRVWIRKDERPIVKITRSHQESVLFGAISLEENNCLDSMTCLTKIHF
jgi:hypothetical protein